MNVFKCDACGKETYIQPKKEVELDSNGKTKYEVINGQRVVKMKALQEQCYIVRIKVNDEIIQRDFCKEHFEEVKPELIALKEKLESFGVQ